MISIREMVSVFFGKKPMEEFAPKRYPIFDGAINYAISLVFPGILLIIIYLLFMLVQGYLEGQRALYLAKEAAIWGFGLAFLLVAKLVADLILAYVWGAVHFFIAKFYAGMPGKLNDFNGSWLSLMGAITLVQMLLFSLPIVATLVSLVFNLSGLLRFLLFGISFVPVVLVQVYSIFLVYKFVSMRFSMPPKRAAIVVLLPLVAVLLVAFVLLLVGGGAYFLIK